MATEYWCKGQQQTNAARLAPQALVDEVNRRMKSPCN
jgi:hypothetical protein